MKFSLTATQLSLIIGFVIPALTALITKLGASDRVKAIVNLALAAIGGWAAAATSTTEYDLKTVLISIGYTFMMSVASYLGFHKPTGTTDAIGNATQNFGF